jgi:hypothetical protein
MPRNAIRDEAGEQAGRNVSLNRGQIIAALITAAGVVAAAFVTGAFSGHAVGLVSEPAVTVTTTVTAPSATGTGRSPAPSAPAGVFYQGPAGIPSTGMDFDYNPPMPGAGNVSATSLGLESFSSNVLLSQYLGSSSKPTPQECRAWVKSHGSYSVGPVPGQGDKFCFLTEQGRTVLFVVTSVNSEPNGSLINGQATVWNAP